MPLLSKDKLNSWTESAFRLVDGSALGFFRIFWGLIMILETRWLWKHLEDLHSDQYFHFYYKGLSWIRHFPEGWMTEVEIIVMLFAAFFIVIGFGFRPAIIIYFLGYTHLFCAEAGAYNNHFYLIILINGILMFSKADNYHSLRQWRRKKAGLSDEGVPRWNYLLIQFQVVILYFYGAIAKLDYDWFIKMEPVKFWLEYGEKVPLWLRGLTTQPWFTYLAAYGGFAIDLICPFMLFHKKLRVPAIIILLSFHFLNSQIFSIGFFPIIGAALLIIILPPNLFRKNRKEHPVDRGPGPAPRFAVIAIVSYCAFQILFPLRWHLVDPPNPSWTDVGHRFSWRMMLRSRVSTLDLRFSDPKVEPWLQQNAHLIPRMTPSSTLRGKEYPNFVWQYVQALHAALSEHGMGDTKIFAHATTSLNGRPYYPVIDPHVDLARAENRFFAVPDWILPLPDDLKIDYQQIMPFEEGDRLGWEAMKRYLDANPGPGSAFLKEKPNDAKSKLPPPSLPDL